MHIGQMISKQHELCKTGVKNLKTKNRIKTLCSVSVGLVSNGNKVTEHMLM